MKEFLMVQRVGDRDKVAYSIKPYAFTIPANPMSDRVQLVLEIESYGIQNVSVPKRSK
jgi:hypothetical protein